MIVWFALFDNLGGGELFIAGVVALLVFGKRLPEVAAQAGQALTKFRRGLDSAWNDTGMDHEIRKIKEAMPKDISMTDMARAASRKMEQRLREMEKGELPSARSSESVDPGAIEDAANATPSSASPSPAAPSAAYSTGLAALTAPATPESPSYTPMPAPSAPASASGTESKGVDPAKHFGPPGSIPRE